MSVVGLHVEVLVNGGEAEPELRRISVAFERAGDELGDFAGNVFPKLGDVFEAEARRQFDGEGAGPGGSWAALSPAYAKWKSQHYPGQPILRASDALYEALTSSSSAHAERVITGDEFSYGTIGLPYASFHQLGTSRMPARPEFDFSSDFERDLTQTAARAVHETIQKHVGEFAEVTP